MKTGPGCVFLVVGASGAGKDSLIAGAKRQLGADSSFLFPQRHITRAADAGGEDHIALDESAFQALRQEGAFALSWGAHGLYYGISSEIEKEIARGQNVVINVSRTVIGMAEDRFPKVVTIHVTVAPDILAERLRQRGREDEADVQRRLARAAAVQVTASRVETVDNSTTLGAAVGAFLRVLNRHGAPPTATSAM